MMIRINPGLSVGIFSMNEDTVLSLENLHLIYDKSRFCIGPDFSLAIRKGELLGVVGESGCGKSTLGKILIGLINKSDSHHFGVRQVEGQLNMNIDGLDKSINYLHTSYKILSLMRKKVQMIFQIPRSALNLKMPVINMLHETSRLGNPSFNKSDRKKIIYDTLIGTGFIDSSVPFDGFENQKLVQSVCGDLSGGERRRISIAKSMVMNPDVLIADEPLSSLDASLKASVLQYLIRMWEKRKDTENPLTMVLISHDIGTISRICSRVIIMYGDHINKRGDIVEDFSYPSNFDYLSEGSYHPYTKNLISAAKYFREHEEQDEDDNIQLDKKLTPNQGCVYGSVCSDKSKECEDSPQYKEIINDKGHFTTCVKQV